MQNPSGRADLSRAELSRADAGLVVMQPTPFCNLACDYCYLPDKNDRRRMSLTTVEMIARSVAADLVLPDRLSICWHAGEPLVVPLDWYRSAIDLCAEAFTARCHVEHAIQTNATLINDDWCRFIRDAEITIGVSIDGPRDIHDRHRRTRSGKGSFDQTMRGIEAIRNHGIPFHIICVLTLDSLRQPDRLFDFFLSCGASDVCFNIEEVEGAHGTSTLLDPTATSLHRFFMRRVLDRANAGPCTMHMRELDQAFHAIACHDGEIALNQQVQPFNILTFDHLGRISTFSPELLGQYAPPYHDFIFGDIHRQSVTAILEHPGYLAAQRDIDAGVERCRAECGYFSVCGGGAPVNKLSELGRLDGTETLFCRLTKQHLIDLVLDDIEAKIESERGGSA